MHRVASKIGLVAAFVAGGAGWLLAVMGLTLPAYAALVGFVTGLTAYAAASHLLGRRLDHVSSVLNDLLAQSGRDAVAGAGNNADELDELVRRSDQALHAVNRHIATLDRAESFRREYVGDVSHEVKTPIFAIQGFAETLLSGALDDRNVSRSFVEKILHHANRLNALATDLSEISRLDTGALKLSIGPFDAGTMLQEVRESFEVAARSKEVDVQLDVDEGARAVQGDRERICQVISNLVDNAIKYTNSGGWVRVGLEQESPEDVRLSVTDNGIGIEPENIDRITERFFRTEKSRSRTQGGTGLGLSIVKHILAAHGSSLRIESRLGEGSVFSFTLPRGAVFEPIKR